MAAKNDKSIPTTRSFVESFGPLGVDLRKHFFLIFSAIPDESMPPYPSHVLGPQDSISQPSSQVSSLPHTSSNSLPSASRRQDRFTTEPPSLEGTPPPSSVAGTTLSSSSVASSHDGSRADVVHQFLRARNISSEDQMRAKYDKSNKDLTFMVGNFYACWSLLNLLGFVEGVAKIRWNHHDIRASAVLKVLGWTSESFQRKKAWYAWGQNTAARLWISPVTAEDEGM